MSGRQYVKILRDTTNATDTSKREVERGETSNSYFVTVYLLLVTVMIGVLSFIPESVLQWKLKEGICAALLIVFFVLVFRVNRIRNLIVKSMSKQTGYKEVYKK